MLFLTIQDNKNKFSGLLLFILTLFIFSNQAKANDPGLDWKTISTQNFKIHFDKKHQSIAFETATIAERIHEKLSKRLNWSPKQKTSLILTDSTDFANGNATPFPNNRSNLIIHPPTDTGFDYDSWLEILLIHEYTHILHLDKATGAPGLLRRIFGRFYLLFPNVFEPNWFIEGLATYIETDVEKHIGRGQSSMFEMMMRIDVDAGIKPLDKVNIRNTQWPINQSYLYGEHFYRFIAKTYGEDKVVKLSDQYGNDLIPYFINRNTSKVLGKDLDQLWSEFSEYLKSRYLPQIEKIKNNTIVDGQNITNQGFYTQVVEATDKGFYYIRKNETESSMLMFQNKQGELESIVEINSSANLDWHPRSGLLIAQPEICKEFNVYYDLYRLHIESNQLERLTTCGRYSQARWSANGDYIVGLKSEAAIFQFDKLSVSGELLQTLWQGQSYQVISDFDLSQDNQKVVASIRDQNSSRWVLKELQLNNLSWIELTTNQNNHVYPRYALDGKSIYFSADFDGIYNLFQMSIDSHEVSQLTNLLGGAFQVVESIDQQSLYYAGYHQQGYDIYLLKLTDQPIETKPTESTKGDRLKLANNLINSESIDLLIPPISPQQSILKKSMTDYSPWHSLKPAYWFPFAQGNEDDTDIGALTSGSDDLGVHQYNVGLASNLTKKSLYGFANYAYSQYFNLSFNREYSYSTEVAGVTPYLLENDLDFSFHLPINRVLSQWNLKAGVSSTHGKRGFFENDDFNMTSSYRDDVVGLGFSFNNSQRYFKSISQNNGRQINFIAESNELLSSSFSGETYTLDWREFFQLYDEHTLAFRFVQGWGTDNPRNFRLGGETADPFFINENNINQRSYALRGYDKGLAQLEGRRMQLASVEYRFPITRIEKTWMAPPIGLGAISGKLFYDRGTAYQDSPIDYYSGSGIELDGQLIFFYLVQLDFTLGYAKGHDLDKDAQTYFRIGSSF